jgi:hypothetical protein
VVGSLVKEMVNFLGGSAKITMPEESTLGAEQLKA